MPKLRMTAATTLLDQSWVNFQREELPCSRRIKLRHYYIGLCDMLDCLGIAVDRDKNGKHTLTKE